MEKERLFTIHSLTLVLVCIALNLAGAQLALSLHLTLFLDSIGTILASALGGFLPGILVGFFSNCLNSISDPITLYYGLISILIALFAALCAQRGFFRHIGRSLLSVLGFAFIGGVFGSVLTWALYGLNIGTGISAPLALSFLKQGLPAFWAQLLADSLIDLLDKLVTVAIVFGVLRVLPDKFLKCFPLGCVYTGSVSPDISSALDPRQYRRFSLRTKVANMIIAASVILSVLAVTISFILYQNTTNARYAAEGQSVALMAAAAVDGDSVQRYLDTLEKDEKYLKTKIELEKLRAAFADVQFVYVYQIREDGCHVVFDLATPDTPAGELGEVVEFDSSFLPMKDDLLAGRSIDPVVSNDAYGWLLTVYRPVLNSEGRCVCYAAVDIAMQNVVSDRYIYIIRMVSLLFGASILIVGFTLWYAQKKLVDPINALAAAASRFAYDSEAHRLKNTRELQTLQIHTGDEIENLFNAISKTTSDVSQYIGLIGEKNADIQRLQDNMILSFADIVENRDSCTGSHVRRTSAYVEIIARSLAKQPKYRDQMSEEYITNIVKSAPLHDIGKVRIPDAILNKPGRLTPEEFEVIKTHTTAGGEILREAIAGVESGYLHEAVDMVTCHHERWDGKGYPAGLSKEKIPLCARIMSIADVFDALISKRSYKEAFGFEEAVDIIRQGAGTQFDPDVVQAFLDALEDIFAVGEHI